LADDTSKISSIPFWLGSFVLAVIVALPYFLRFKSQVSGVQLHFWLPDVFTFTLLWGGWWIWGCLSQCMPRGDEPQSKEAIFRRLLLAIGLIALVAPFAFYIRGYFGDGDLRHQDTVFKFGLQAWILVGIGVSSEFFVRYRALTREIRTPSYPIFAVFVAVLMLAPVTVFYTRAIGYGAGGLSLNSMQFLPEAEQKAILWLQENAPKKSVVLQNATLRNDFPIGDYDGQCGSIATFTGIPTPLGWPQHVWMWGADMNDVKERGAHITNIYAQQDWKKARAFGVTHVYNRAITSPEQPKTTLFKGSDGSSSEIISLR
jgi:hypothetical protein